MDSIRRRVAHDLGSACTVAQLSFDALDQGLSPFLEDMPLSERDEMRQTMRILAQSLDMVADLQQQLRKSRSQLERTPELLDLTDQFDLVKRLIPPRDVDRIQVDLPQELKVRADALHFSRILINLVYNALRMVRDTPRPAGQVRLAGSLNREGQVQITVSDDGPGIAEALRDRIFEAGFSTRSDGSGLGLAISRELAVGEGGSLILTATAESGGAQFVLTLPNGQAPPD